MKLFPFMDVVKNAQDKVDQGNIVFQQFECSSCHKKQTMETPNTFYGQGQCEECGSITDIVSDGCNFVLVAVLGVNELVDEILGRKEHGNDN